MNHSRKLAAVILGAASVLAMSPTHAAVSIADSWHNLGAGNTKKVTPNGGSPANHSAQTTEICVFCHTPHGGDNQAAVPIWNRKLSAPTAYKRYSELGTVTFDATEAPIGSVTIACLSCHDGTQAIDNVLNAPGSGGYNFDKGVFIGGGAGTSMVGADVGADGSLREGIDVVQNLGTDLSNDHPVSMQYGGGGISVASPSGPTKDADFTGTKTNPCCTLNSAAAPSSSQLGMLWWIERGAKSLNPTGRDRADVILYTRNDIPGDPRMQPTVECGSCHDPHNVDNPTFLRVSNIDKSTEFPNATGSPSGLCLTCHVK